MKDLSLLLFPGTLFYFLQIFWPLYLNNSENVFFPLQLFDHLEKLPSYFNIPSLWANITDNFNPHTLSCNNKVTYNQHKTFISWSSWYLNENVNNASFLPRNLLARFTMTRTMVSQNFLLRVKRCRRIPGPGSDSSNPLIALATLFPRF